METLTMSRKERERLTVMTGVSQQELTLVLAAVSGPGRRGFGASAAGTTQRAAQATGTARAGAGPLCRGTLCRLRPDTDGRATVEGKAGGGSRDAAALAAGGGPAHGETTQAKAPAVAGTQALLWGDGATG